MHRFLLAIAALVAIALTLPADAQVGYTRIGSSVLYSQNGGTRVDWQPGWAGRQLPPNGIAIGQEQPLRQFVQDGQQLIGRERTIQNMNTKPGHLGGSQVYGDKCLNDSLGLDTSACSFCRTLEADCHYISVEGKDGTGIGCDLNRPRRQDGQAYCFQAYADGPGSLAYLRANDVAINDPKLRLLKMRTNGLAIDIEQTGTRTPGLPSITLQGPNGQGFEWILTNDGNIARRAGAGDFWAGDAISVVTGDVVMVNAAGQPMLRIRQSDGCIVLRSGTVMC